MDFSIQINELKIVRKNIAIALICYLLIITVPLGIFLQIISLYHIKELRTQWKYLLFLFSFLSIFYLGIIFDIFILFIVEFHLIKVKKLEYKSISINGIKKIVI